MSAGRDGRGEGPLLWNLDAGVVDTVEIAVMPVLLGEGIPLLPPGSMSKLVPTSGILVLSYSVRGAAASAPPIRYVKPMKRQAPKASARRRKAARRSTSSRAPRVGSAARKTRNRR